MSRLTLDEADVFQRGQMVRQIEVISLNENLHHLVGPQPKEKIWSANSRIHHMTRARKARCWRIGGNAFGLALLQDLDVPHLDGKWRVSISIGVRSRAVRDPHNYSSSVLKSVVDGLVDAGLWPDDNPAYVTTTEPGFAVHKKDQPLTLAIDLDRVSL